MRRPFVMVALCYAGGLLAADWVAFPWFPLWATSVLLGALALGWRRGRAWLLGPLLFVTGATNLTLGTTVFSPHDLRRIFADRTEDVWVRGRLAETPYQRVYERDDRESWRTVAELDVAAVRVSESEWQPGFGRVAVSTAGQLPERFFGGQSVEIRGIIRVPQGAVAEGLFDYRLYLRRLGIHYQVQVDSPNDWRPLSENASPPLADRFAKWAKQVLALGLPVEDEPLRLLWAMTLGWKTALNGEISDPFMRSGTMHVFAISGLHIALLAGILVALLRVLQLPRAWCGLLVVPLLWAYTGVTGWQASAIRSTIMMTVIILGWSLKRPGDLLNSLAAAGFVILLWDPQQLFQASFQLSFFVVLSIALFAPLLKALKARILGFDPLRPMELVPPWQRRAQGVLGWLAEGLCTSLAAWLGSIPLVAYYFHYFTPSSLLANLIVVPLSSAALASNMASLTVGAWLPGLAEYFNHAAWLFMLLMIRVSAWAADLPAGCVHLATPGIPLFVLYYAVLISWAAGWLHQPGTRRWLAAGWGALAAGCLIQWLLAQSTTRLSILALSGAEVIYCDAPGRADDLLVDCGSESSVLFATKPFLRAQGVNGLPGMVLTHGDLRQVGGAGLIQEGFSVRRIYLGSASFRSTAYRRLRERFKKSRA